MDGNGTVSFQEKTKAFTACGVAEVEATILDVELLSQTYVSFFQCKDRLCMLLLP